MTPADLKNARHALGLSAERFARVLGVSAGRTVQRWEAGDRHIPGTVEVLVHILLASAQARKIAGVESVHYVDDTTINRCSMDTDRPAPEAEPEIEIEITPEMMKAGVEANSFWDPCDLPEWRVDSIYTAMEIARRRAKEVE